MPAYTPAQTSQRGRRARIPMYRNAAQVVMPNGRHSNNQARARSPGPRVPAGTLAPGAADPVAAAGVAALPITAALGSAAPGPADPGAWERPGEASRGCVTR